MTIGLPHIMQLADRAMMGVPHVNASETLLLMRYMTEADREQALRCYASIVGERTLPAHINAGRAAFPSPHGKAPAARRDDARPSKPRRPAPYNHLTVKRAAAARRVLEARRDLEQE